MPRVKRLTDSHLAALAGAVQLYARILKLEARVVAIVSPARRLELLAAAELVRDALAIVTQRRDAAAMRAGEFSPSLIVRRLLAADAARAPLEAPATPPAEQLEQLEARQ